MESNIELCSVDQLDEVFEFHGLYLREEYLIGSDRYTSGLSYICLGLEMSHRRGSDQPPPVRILRTQTAENLGELILDIEALPSSLREIASNSSCG
ncbi:callose synthase 2 [Quercus suber]|uniref:Callose synthase 2 n=1 Tax=Quercus suber TaxID=58331 RepID=A0AAW0L920_QUESU